jgi:trimethylamine--corrinoid protein Co-methyltransferase
MSDESQKRIHQAGLQILAQTGILVEDESVCDHLIAYGCHLHQGRITIPISLTEKSLELVPSSFPLYDRHGTQACVVGGEDILCQPVGGTPFVIDQESGARRHALLRDLIDMVRLAQRLDHIHILTTMTTPTDVDDALQTFIGFASTLMYSNKPVSAPGPTSSLEVQIYARLAEVISGHRDYLSSPSFVVSILPISPLQFPKGLADAIAETARLGIPISIVPLPVLGISSPISFSGALAQQHAENLATVVIAQSINPGLPMVYHGRLSIGDMRTGASIWGFYQVGLAGAWAVALGKLCGMPTNVYGYATSSKSTDIQSGAERALNAVLPALAGADIIGGAGSIADIMAVSPLQLVIDNEMMTWLDKISLQSALDEIDIPLDVIDSVAKLDHGTYLNHLHTVSSLRKNRQWIGDLCDRLSFTEYEDTGQRGMLELAKERVHKILTSTSPDPIVSKETQKEIQSILDWAKKELNQ